MFEKTVGYTQSSKVWFVSGAFYDLTLTILKVAWLISRQPSIRPSEEKCSEKNSFIQMQDLTGSNKLS